MEKQRVYRDSDTQPIPVTVPLTKNVAATSQQVRSYYTPREQKLEDTYEMSSTPWPSGTNPAITWRDRMPRHIPMGNLPRRMFFIPMMLVDTIFTLFFIIFLTSSSLTGYQNSLVPQGGESLGLAQHLLTIITFMGGVWGSFRVAFREYEVTPRTAIAMILPWALLLSGISPLN